VTTIETATGRVKLAELTPLLYHEHVTLDNRRVQGLEAYWLPDGSVMEVELRALRAAGGRSLVSLTNQCMGRDVAAMQRLSAATGVEIILATGLYTRPASPTISSVKALASQFVHELTHGIGQTGVRAQVIGEIGTGAWPIGQFERDLFDAAAIAHLETGAPIATHTHGGKYARWQLDRLTSHGVPAERIAIGHLDEGIIFGETYLAQIAELARRGCFLGFDTIGITYYSPFMRRHQPSDEARAKAVKRLVNLSLGSQLLLAHDICRPDHLRTNGGWGYGHLFSTFLPMLEREGVEHATAISLVAENPIRWLGGR
jgi:phosphotriesterase-related protein